MQYFISILRERYEFLQIEIYKNLVLFNFLVFFREKSHKLRNANICLKRIFCNKCKSILC